MKRQRTRSYTDSYYDRPLVLRELVVFEEEGRTINSGLLDASGRPIIYTEVMMNQIGFIHFDNTRDHASYEEDA